MTTTRKQRYPSDLTDTQWSRLEEVLPAERTVGRHRTIEPRDVANAISYRWETGCVWRMLPHDFPPWGTVYAYFRNWQRAGVIRQMREILLEPKPKAVRRFDAPHQHEAFSPPLDRDSSPGDFDSAQEPGFSSPHDRREFRPQPELLTECPSP